MNISKLIETLQDVYDRYGDIPVNAESPCSRNPFDYTLVRITDDRNGENPEVKCAITGYEPKSLKDKE